MTQPTPPTKKPATWKRLSWSACYIAIAVWFVSTVLDNRQCDVGFTSMLAVGDAFYDQSIPDFQYASPRIFENSSGYDAQFYSQIALDPTLREPALATGVDSLGYRARRILMPAIAWALGTGDPKRIINVYPLINPLCWLISAILLLHWLPPHSIQNLLRWSGILLGWGWITSIERSLTDGPAATLTLLALYFISKGKVFNGAFAIAASALTKDTSILAGLGLLPDNWKTRKGLARFAVLGLIAAAPLFLWWLYIGSIVPPGSPSAMGSGNFALPFQGIYLQLKEQFGQIGEVTFGNSYINFLSFVAIAIHIAFFIFRPDWKNAIWRACAPFAILGIFLGNAVWEGAPGAAPRVLMVLHIGFNLLAPRTKAWLPLLLLANISVFAFPHLMEPPERSQRSEECIEKRQFLTTAGDIDPSSLSISFLDGWHQVETKGDRAWKWTQGASSIRIENYSNRPVRANMTLRMRAVSARDCIVEWNQQLISTIQQEQALANYDAGTVVVEPGINILTLRSNSPDLPAGPQDSRLIGTSLFQITLNNNSIVQIDDRAGADELSYRFADGWYDEEKDSERIWRWSSGRGKIIFQFESETSASARAELTLRPFKESGSQISWNGETISKTSGEGRFVESETSVFTIKPGQNELLIENLKPPSRASNEDTRTLGSALYRLKITSAE